jgi:hypothetical protein
VKKLFFILSVFCFSTLANAEGWQLSQVKIKHLQSGNGDVFYFSFSKDTKVVSQCEVGSWGADWGAVSLTSMSEQKKYLLTLAMSAHASGKLVDIGGTKGSCMSSFGDVPEITYIRVGDFRQ